MNLKSIKDIVSKKDIKWIQVHFTDIIGGLRVLHIPANRFFDDNVIKKGINFDGSSIGFRQVERSDMIALPDIETFKYLPYKKLKYKFDFEIGYLTESPCRECEKRKDFPDCIDDCNKLDKIHTILCEAISCSKRG